MPLPLLAGIVGGVGLLLLGMYLMTDGLRLASGRALSGILERWTGSPLRGLAAGTLLTAIVQSSSAVTVTTIGFVNAGLMTLGQSLWVIYGSNVGTTMTGWLVAAVGFHVQIKAFALPAIGAGMVLRLAARERALAHAGVALAGFGIFFLGIETLRDTFLSLGAGIHFDALSGGGAGRLPLAIGAGFLLTLLMQSSSAALAVVLTAAAAGHVPLDVAAAGVIGANVGTTSTAALSVIGATPNAKRVAAAHIAFNVVTALAALALLPFLIAALAGLGARMRPGGGPAAVLALFHSAFNLLGVLLLWPLSHHLLRVLGGWFRSAEEDESRPRHLDQTLVDTPRLALHALDKELGRIGAIARRAAGSALSARPELRAIRADGRAIDALVEAVGDFVNAAERAKIPEGMAGLLPGALRVARYDAEVAELAHAIGAARLGEEKLAAADLGREIDGYLDEARRFVAAADPLVESWTRETSAARIESLEKHYGALKSKLLSAGVQGRLPVRALVDRLDTLSDVRRLAQQVERGARHQRALRLDDPAQIEAALAP